MRPIYLASNSKARAALLKNAGLVFKVVPSDVKEERKARGSWTQLVKANALRKAKDVASRVPSGIIIAADTIVVQGKTVFGKPRDVREAGRILKKLGGKAQTVYTGIAVVDKDNQKTKVGSEKTKIYMDRLSDEEIEKYFSSVSPLDKAGAFDIQGKGAFFIRRVEGCFYNVVGLPLRKLYVMLEGLDISLLALLFCAFSLASTVFVSGCSTEYNIVTGEEEKYYYSTDKEVAIGRSIAKQVAKQYKLDVDPLIQKRVEDIGKKLVAVCDRKDIDYTFIVLADDEVNAVSLPGGWVYVNKGLIDKVTSDDQLACVIGHEVGHIVARHSIKKLQAEMGYSIFRIMAATVPGSGAVGATADAAFTELLLGYSRDDELLADKLGTRYARLAGYNPHGMLEFLTKLEDINKRKPLQPKTYFKTHPYVPDRIRIVKQELGEKIQFNDYINIEQPTRQ